MLSSVLRSSSRRERKKRQRRMPQIDAELGRTLDALEALLRRIRDDERRRLTGGTENK